MTLLFNVIYFPTRSSCNDVSFHKSFGKFVLPVMFTGNRNRQCFVCFVFLIGILYVSNIIFSNNVNFELLHAMYFCCIFASE